MFSKALQAMHLSFFLLKNERLKSVTDTVIEMVILWYDLHLLAPLLVQIVHDVNRESLMKVLPLGFFTAVVRILHGEQSNVRSD